MAGGRGETALLVLVDWRREREEVRGRSLPRLRLSSPYTQPALSTLDSPLASRTTGLSTRPGTSSPAALAPSFAILHQANTMSSLPDLAFDLVSASEIPAAYVLEIAGFPADEAASLESLQSVSPSSASAASDPLHPQDAPIPRPYALPRRLPLYQRLLYAPTRRLHLLHTHPFLDSHA